jgi:hypothetical protein
LFKVAMAVSSRTKPVGDIAVEPAQNVDAELAGVDGHIMAETNLLKLPPIG